MATLLPVSVVTTGMAQPAPHSNYGLSETSLVPFKKVVLNANVDVTLVQEADHHVAYTEGQPNLVSDIVFEVMNETLYIRSVKNRNYNGKIQVTVPVNGLEKIEVNGRADVVSLNTLESPQLKVHFNGEVTARILSSGKVELSVDENYAVSELSRTKTNRVK